MQLELVTEELGYLRAAVTSHANRIDEKFADEPHSPLIKADTYAMMRDDNRAIANRITAILDSVWYSTPDSHERELDRPSRFQIFVDESDAKLRLKLDEPH